MTRNDNDKWRKRNIDERLSPAGEETQEDSLEDSVSAGPTFLPFPVVSKSTFSCEPSMILQNASSCRCHFYLSTTIFLLISHLVLEVELEPLILHNENEDSFS